MSKTPQKIWPSHIWEMCTLSNQGCEFCLFILSLHFIHCIHYILHLYEMLLHYLYQKELCHKCCQSNLDISGESRFHLNSSTLTMPHLNLKPWPLPRWSCATWPSSQRRACLSVSETYIVQINDKRIWPRTHDTCEQRAWSNSVVDDTCTYSWNKREATNTCIRTTSSIHDIEF